MSIHLLEELPYEDTLELALQQKYQVFLYKNEEVRH